MKIDPNSLSLQQGIQSKQVTTGRTASRSVESLYGSQAEAAGGSQESSPAQDHVQLSGLSSHLQLLSQDSPERTARLEELTRLVESGGYKTDSREVSSRLLDEVFG